MKKSLIAASASAVALAAMPVMGVFAETVTTGAGSYEDDITVTVEPICTFSRQSTAHPNNGNPNAIGGSGSASTIAWVAGSAVTPTTGGAGRVDSINMGTLIAGNTYYMGSSAFNVTCNTSGGYDVNLTATSLHDQTTYGDATSDDITYSGAEVSTSGSTWTVSNTELTNGDMSGATYYTNGGKVQTSAGATTTSGDNFTVHYHLGLKSNQSKGNFTGSATYTLVQPAVNTVNNG